METKYTKGEWKTICHSKSKKWFTIYNDDGAIARTFYGDLEPVMTLEEAESNAKLICAAPDMLEALIKMCEYHEAMATWDKGDNGYYLAKGIIKKATE